MKRAQLQHASCYAEKTKKIVENRLRKSFACDNILSNVNLGDRYDTSDCQTQENHDCNVRGCGGCVFFRKVPFLLRRYEYCLIEMSFEDIFFLLSGSVETKQKQIYIGERQCQKINSFMTSTTDRLLAK